MWAPVPASPGILPKIMCPAIKLTLLEATAKKVQFLEHVVEALELQDVVVIHGRAEDLGRIPSTASNIGQWRELWLTCRSSSSISYHSCR